jgi:hypothetical protein
MDDKLPDGVRARAMIEEDQSGTMSVSLRGKFSDKSTIITECLPPPPLAYATRRLEGILRTHTYPGHPDKQQAVDAAAAALRKVMDVFGVEYEQPEGPAKGD